MEHPDTANASTFEDGGDEDGVGFVRQTDTRSTVAKRCREYYMQRLERTETLRQQWGKCESGIQPQANDAASPESAPGLRVNPPQKWSSSLDLAMSALKKEITSLISQDNDLFRQLLALHDSITELRDRHQSSLTHIDMDSRTPSLESLSDAEDPGGTSPASTLSSCSSHHLHSLSSSSSSASSSAIPRPPPVLRSRAVTVAGTTTSSSRLLTLRSPDFCWRCRTGRKAAPLYNRRANSHSNLHWRHDDVDSCDSGIHLHGAHSDSDHEIFV